MGETRDPIVVPISDMAAIGMGDLWHIDVYGVGRKLGGFDHRLGWKLVDSVYSWMPSGGRLIYDPSTCPYCLELVLH